MVFRILADLTVAVHLLFVVFVVLGGLLALKRRCWVWLHLPVLAWGVAIELFGWTCPLTPLENWFREQAGQAGYQSSFIEHYLIPIVYPPGLSRGIQILLASLLLGFNVAVYGWLYKRR